MNKNNILESIKKLREVSKERKFKQSFDLIINLKQLNPKNEDQRVDLFLQLPKTRTKKPKICALVDKELDTKAKIFDKVILKEDFQKYSKDKKLTKQLASKYDFFLAQANLMGEIATAFGKVLGPKGKMPNPKAGGIVPPVIPSLEPIKQKIESTIRFITKDQLVVKAPMGTEDMSDEDLTENIHSAFNALLHALPKENDNLKSVFLKLTMSPAVEITDKGPVLHDHSKKEEPKEEPKPKDKKEEKKE
jgi:large subunit ribosomal protein L1